MRAWLVAALAAIMGLLGLATRNPALEKGALALIVLLAVGFAYRALLTGRVQALRQVATPVVPWGGAFTQQMTLTNAARLSVPTARVVDRATLPGHPRGFVAALPGRRSLTWDVRVPCRTRGRYTLGPVEINTGDPLRFFPATREVAGATSVLVLPRWVVLTQVPFSLDGALLGDQRGTLRGESPPSVAGIRTYQPGDALSRIHWAASARAGALLTKQFDPEVRTTLWLALDLDGQMSPDTEELLVTAATSLGMYALQQANLHVALVASGASAATLVPERGRGQQQRLQEMLAEVHAGTKATLVEQMARMDRHLAARHVVVLLTARPSQEWTRWLDHLHQRGIITRVVQVQAEPKGSAHRTGEATQEEDASGWPVPHILLPGALADPARQDALALALEVGGEQMQRA